MKKSNSIPTLTIYRSAAIGVPATFMASGSTDAALVALPGDTTVILGTNETISTDDFQSEEASAGLYSLAFVETSGGDADHNFITIGSDTGGGRLSSAPQGSGPGRTIPVDMSGQTVSYGDLSRDPAVTSFAVEGLGGAYAGVSWEVPTGTYRVAFGGGQATANPFMGFAEIDWDADADSATLDALFVQPGSQITVIPEPSAMSLLSLGAAGLLARRRRTSAPSAPAQ